MRLVSEVGAGLLILLAAACGPRPVVTPDAPVAFDDKVSWVLRLEQERVLRDPPPPPPPIPEGETEPVEPPPAPRGPRPDLEVLLQDVEPQIRRRAAQAIGRVGLTDGLDALTAALSDPEVEVRQMSAFALGLLGDLRAVDALVAALADPEPVVQGRAAEALGRLGATGTADRVGEVAARYVTSVFAIDPEDLSYPLAPEAEAFRLSAYALGELEAFEPLASAVLQDDGQPLLWWWPVAYALQRTGDPRAFGALVTLAGVQGSVGVSFAAQGLGRVGHVDPERAVDALVALLDRERRDDRVVATAARALGAIDDPRAGAALRELILRRDLSDGLRLAGLRALVDRPAADTRDLFVELMTASWAPYRATAGRALARSDPEAFLLVLSGLPDDPDWSVRAAIAQGLADVNPAAAEFQLRQRLPDADGRVVPFVLRSLAAIGASDLEAVLLDALTHEDVVVRATAAELLGAEGLTRGSDVVAALLTAYDAAVADPSYQARAAIVDALGRSDAAQRRDLLERALADDDWAVRMRAEAHLADLPPSGDPDLSARPAPVRRSLDFEDPVLVSPSVSPRVYIETDLGTIELELAVIDAPVAAENFAALRALRRIRFAADKHGVPITLCGEMAADPLQAMALIGLGFRSISMAPAAIGPVKTMLLSLDSERLQNFVEARMEPDCTGSIRDDLRRFAELNSVEI